MRHDAKAAAEFLRLVRPGGPWHLVVINPDTRKVRGRSVSTDEEVAAWLAEHADWNCYYHVNPTTRAAGKAERAEIAEVAFFHVDLDPRSQPRDDVAAGVPVATWFAAERERICKRLADDKTGLPPPTFVIGSGTGVNALWALAAPLPVEGTSEEERIASAESIARYNLQIERLLEGDHCHNVDRVLRLPYTVNWPDAKKRERGRVPAMSSVLVSEPSRVYPVDRFIQAPEIADKSGLGGAGRTVKVSGNVPRFRGADDLPAQLTQRVRDLIVLGHDPAAPGKYPSRSEALWHALCEMARAGMTDDQMYSVITDPQFAIAASVIEHPRSEKYALRQIGRARDHAIDPRLVQMNDRHAVVRNYGGKCRVIEVVTDPVLNRPLLTKQTFDDLRNSYMHERVDLGKNEKGQPITTHLGKFWLEHPRRRQYDRVVFAPNREIPGAYNLWRGFAVEPVPGDRHASFLAYLKKVICRGVQEHYDYLVRWLAAAVQRPAQPGEVAIVLRGGEGTGKSFFANQFGRLWGSHYLPITDAKHLVGSFNAHLRDCVFLFADEAFAANDREGAEKLKTMITEKTLAIEPKGVDVEFSPNYIHLMMASNHRWVVPASHDSRRYAVYDVSGEHKEDLAYFGAIAADMEAGGASNLLDFLLKYDVRTWRPIPAPVTSALHEQRELTLSSEEEWWLRKLQEGRLLDGASWTDPVSKDDLIRDYYDYVRNLGYVRRVNATALARFLSRAVPEGYPRLAKIQSESVGISREIKKMFVPAYKFPPLAECRGHWDAYFGGSGDWPTELDKIEDIVVEDEVPF